MVDNCKAIEHLNLTRLPKLTGVGVEAVAKGGLHHLEYLNLYASTSVENYSFMTLADSGYSKLKFLDLCGSKEI